VNFEKLDAHLVQFYEDHPDLPGCDILVQQNHTVLFRAQYGLSDLDAQTPVKGDELYCLYSCSKPVTVTGLLRLLESGKIALDDPAAKYLSCFADAYLLKDGERIAPQNPITIRHLLTMTAGFTYNTETEPLRELFAQGSGRISTTDYAKALLASPLAFEPGTRYNYSLCHDLLGAIIEAVSDMPFGEYQKKNIFEPLGMTRTGFFTTLPGDISPAPMYIYSVKKQATLPFPEFYDCGLSKRYESGGAGMLSTVEDYGRFAATMAHNGVSADGYRLLSPETIQMMKQEQLSTIAPSTIFSCAAGPGYGYGLGVRTLIDKSDGQRSPLGEFGWDGAAGAYILMDTDHDLSISYATHLRNWHGGFGSIHIPVRDLVYDAIGIS
jgi:CubicO group peptidase (beta-lactamase class C family)